MIVYKTCATGHPRSSFSKNSWTRALDSQILSRNEALLGQRSSVNESGLEIRFDMYPPELKKKGRDVDNLSQSVFSAVVNSNKGWFGGKRPNIQWWKASKCPHQEEGCQIEIHASKAPLFDFNEDDIIVRDIFRTDKLEPAYLENRQEEDFDNYKNRLRGWLQEKARPVKAKGAFAVWLRFPSKKVNLGEIPTGHIKPIIDSMVPTIMADDTYIVDLQVEKGTLVIPLNEVEILITTVQTMANVT